MLYRGTLYWYVQPKRSCGHNFFRKSDMRSIGTAAVTNQVIQYRATVKTLPCRTSFVTAVDIYFSSDMPLTAQKWILSVWSRWITMNSICCMFSPLFLLFSFCQIKSLPVFVIESANGCGKANRRCLMCHYESNKSRFWNYTKVYENISGLFNDEIRSKLHLQPFFHVKMGKVEPIHVNPR